MPLPPHTYKKPIEEVSEVIRTEIPCYPDEKKFHIWQASENARMLHALQNWDWFVRDKPKLLRYLANVTRRPIAMLRMDSGGKHRLKMENIEALESVKTNDMRFRTSDHYWKLSLRNNWGKVENFKDGYFHAHHGNKVGFIRIGDPTRLTIPAIIYFKDTSRRQDESLSSSKWGDYERFMQALEDAIANAQYFYPSFWNLQVEGIPVRPPDWWPDGQEPDHRESEEEESMMEEAAETIDYIDRNIDWQEKPQKPLGPVVALSRRHLVFCEKPGKIDQKTVMVKNKGSVVLFYCWQRRPVEPLILPGRKKEAGERLFSLMGGTGSLLPGEKRRFCFKFYSNQIGTHMEVWLCRIYPKPKAEVRPVILKGVTTFDDGKVRRWQSHLERVLNYREMMRGIGEALHDVLETAAKCSRPTAELRDREYINSTAAFNFMSKNLKMNPPLFFTPSGFSKLEKLAQVLMPHGGPEHASPLGSLKEPGPAMDGPTVMPEEGKTLSKSQEDPKQEKRKRSSKKVQSVGEVPPKEATTPSVLERKSKLGQEGLTKDQQNDQSKKGKRSSPRKESSGEATAISQDRATDAISGEQPVAPPPPAPRVVSREDMFCKPCSDTYLSPQLPPPPPPLPAAWAGSIPSILLAIKACPDKKRRRALKLEARELLESAAIPPHQTSLLLMAMYKSLQQISGDFESVIETVSEDSGHPIVEQLLRMYYEQIEAKQAAEEAAERVRDLEDNAMDWPFDEDDTESAILGDEIREEAKRQQAHDMLHYIMRWVHVLTEAKGILKHGFGNFQEMVEKEQATVALLIEEKLQELSLRGPDDDDACWKGFDLERKKQVLDEEFQELPKCLLPNCEDCPAPQVAKDPPQPLWMSCAGCHIPRNDSR